MNASSEAKLSQVNPALANIVRQLAAAVSSKYGGTIQVVSGYRSYASQAALYANRASNPNPVAVPGTSKHGKGLAVDLRFNGVSANTVGVLGESMGLRWGGRFSKRDPAHFELQGAAYIPASNGVEVPRDDVQYADSNYDVLPRVDAEHPQVQAADLYLVGALFLLALMTDW
jgi:hypothetical protein